MYLFPLASLQIFFYAIWLECTLMSFASCFLGLCLGFVEILGLQFVSNWKHFGHYFFKYLFQSSILFPLFQVPQYTYLKSHNALFFPQTFLSMFHF